MTYKETLFFVGECLTINHEDKNKQAIETHLSEGLIDWEAVVRVSTAHFVFPALYVNLKRADFLHFLPKDLVGYMEYITDLNRERNIQIINQALEINALLLENGITPVFLKGTGNLLEGLYDDIGERMVGDIDFVVIQSDFFKTADILQAAGYIHNSTIERYYHWHYPALTHPDKIATVEIHQKILKDNFQQKLGIKLFNDLQFVAPNIQVLNIKNKVFASSLPKIINDNLYHIKKISLRNAYDLFLLSKKIPLNEIMISKPAIYRKWLNYTSCLKLLFPACSSILIAENKDTKSYQESYMKLLDGNKQEKRKTKVLDLLVRNKNRILIIKQSFTNRAYRNFVVKRVFQWELYKNLFRISTITFLISYL